MISEVSYFLGRDFKDFVFLPLPGEMIQFDEHIFENGLKPPTSVGLRKTMKELVGNERSTNMTLYFRVMKHCDSPR